MSTIQQGGVYDRGHRGCILLYAPSRDVEMR
jgi:hypothetical protein